MGGLDKQTHKQIINLINTKTMHNTIENEAKKTLTTTFINHTVDKTTHCHTQIKYETIDACMANFISNIRQANRMSFSHRMNWLCAISHAIVTIGFRSTLGHVSSTVAYTTPKSSPACSAWSGCSRIRSFGVE